MDGRNYRVDTKSGKVEVIGASKPDSGTVSVLPVPFAVRAEKAESRIRKISENLYSINIKGYALPMVQWRLSLTLLPAVLIIPSWVW